MAFQFLPLLLSAIPGAIKTGASYFMKPKRVKPDTSYFDKYTANLRSDIADPTFRNLMVSSATQNAGAIQGNVNRNIESQNRITGMEGSGLEAQQRLSSTQDIIESVNKEVTNANIGEMQRIQPLKQNLREAELKRDEYLAQVKEQNRQAEEEWRNEVNKNLIGMGADVLTAGVTQGVALAQESAQARAKYNMLKKEGKIPIDTKTMPTDKYGNLLTNDAGDVLFQPLSYDKWYENYVKPYGIGNVDKVYEIEAGDKIFDYARQMKGNPVAQDIVKKLDSGIIDRDTAIKELRESFNLPEITITEDGRTITGSGKLGRDNKGKITVPPSGEMNIRKVTENKPITYKVKNKDGTESVYQVDPESGIPMLMGSMGTPSPETLKFSEVVSEGGKMYRVTYEVPMGAENDRSQYKILSKSEYKPAKTTVTTSSGGSDTTKRKAYRLKEPKEYTDADMINWYDDHVVSEIKLKKDANIKDRRSTDRHFYTRGNDNVVYSLHMRKNSQGIFRLYYDDGTEVRYEDYINKFQFNPHAYENENQVTTIMQFIEGEQ